MGLGLAAVREMWGRWSGGVSAAADGARKTQMSVGQFPFLTPLAGGGQAAVAGRPTTAMLRRMAETPMARRAINVIKDRVAALDWRLAVRAGCTDDAGAQARIAALRAALERPNGSDSFRTLVEQVLEDVLVCGNGAMEIELTMDAARPVRLYPVDGASIEVDPRWDGEAGTARYAQRGPVGAAAARTPLLDAEVMFVRLNPRTYSPFGLGKMEVAYEAMTQFLEAHRFAGRMADNTVMQYALWMEDRTPEQHERLAQWWRDEVEGSGRVPMLSSPEKPEVLRFAGGTDAELRLQWQEFLLRMIANAFDLPAMVLGVAHDVNRSTAGGMQDEMFQTAIVPLAKLLAEHMTRDVIGKALGWEDVQFVWSGLESRDEMKDVEIQTKLLAAGVLTVDEVRKERGLGAKPVDDNEVGDGR